VRGLWGLRRRFWFWCDVEVDGDSSMELERFLLVELEVDSLRSLSMGPPCRARSVIVPEYTESSIDCVMVESSIEVCNAFAGSIRCGF